MDVFDFFVGRRDQKTGVARANEAGAQAERYAEGLLMASLNLYIYIYI